MAGYITDPKDAPVIADLITKEFGKKSVSYCEVGPGGWIITDALIKAGVSASDVFALELGSLQPGIPAGVKAKGDTDAAAKGNSFKDALGVDPDVLVLPKVIGDDASYGIIGINNPGRGVAAYGKGLPMDLGKLAGYKIKDSGIVYFAVKE